MQIKRFLIIFFSLTSFHLSAENSGPDLEKSNIQQADKKTASNNSVSNNKTVIKEAVLGMNVSGNKELPNVLYIIPWKKSSIEPLDNPPVQNLLLDEIFAPIDPDAFSKKVKFYDQMTSTQKEIK